MRNQAYRPSVREPAGDANLESTARPAPRTWRSPKALREAGFVAVRGGLPAALAASRMRRLARQMVALRKRAGLTRAQVARRMNTTTSYVARMETDTPMNLTLATLEQFARAIGADFCLAMHPLRSC